MGFSIQRVVWVLAFGIFSIQLLADEKTKVGCKTKLSKLDSRPFRMNFNSSWLDQSVGEASRSLWPFRGFNKIYGKMKEDSSHRDLTDKILSAMNVSLEFNETDLKLIPKTGPLIVGGNHPTGGMDGIALASIVAKVRTDVKIVAMKGLEQAPEAHEHLILVDKSATEAARTYNLEKVKEMFRWLKAGHVLVMFPAGDMSLRNQQGELEESPWKREVPHFMAKTGASFLGIYNSTSPSFWFKLFKNRIPYSNYSLIPHEILRMKGRVMNLEIKFLAKSEDLKDLGPDPEAQAKELRRRTLH